MDRNEKIRAMAAIVVELQSRYDAENHRTTGCYFMYGNISDTRRPPFDEAEWKKRRAAIMGPIEQMRTEAIWALSKLLDTADHRIGRELLDAHQAGLHGVAH
jgi:hypothetical protein